MSLKPLRTALSLLGAGCLVLSTPASAQQLPDPRQLSSDAGIHIPGFTPPKQDTQPEQKVETSPETKEFFTNVWGKNRRYLVDLPANYNPARRYPVLIGFAGRRQSAERFRGFSRFQDTGAAQAIRVYPATWGQSWEGARYSTTRAGEDVAFTHRIIDEVQARFSVDRSRIYAAGLSNGGTMAALVACKMPNRVAGVVVVSGLYFTPVTSGCRPEPVAVKLMHGSADGFSQFGGVSSGGVYVPVRSVLGMYQRRNACGGQTTSPIPNGQRTRYQCARADTQLVITRKGHSWHLTDKIQDEIWNFLAPQRL